MSALARTLHLFERISLTALIVLIPFRLRTLVQSLPYPPVYADYTDFLVFASDIALIVLLLVWMLRRTLFRTHVHNGPLFLTVPLLALLVTGLLSMLHSAAPLVTLQHLARLGLLFGMYLYLANEIRSLKEIVLPVALMIVVQAVPAVAQFLLQRSIGLQALGELELDPSWFGVSIVWSPGAVALRSYGLSDHPNLLGGCLALGILLLLIAQVNGEGWMRLPTAFTIGLGLIALLLTFSRAAWLGLAAGFLTASALLLYAKQREHLRALWVQAWSPIVLTLPFLIATAPFLLSRLTPPPPSELPQETLLSPEARAVAERALLVEAANALFTANPITGVGLGASPVALRDMFPDFEPYYQPAHFVLLDAAVETGLLGGLAYFLAISLPWIVVAIHRNTLSWSPGLLAACSLLAAVTIIGFFDYYPWSLPPGRIWHWIIWGLFAAIYRKNLRAND